MRHSSLSGRVFSLLKEQNVDNNEDMKAVRYEMLGAPTLIYRHSNDNNQRRIFRPKTQTPQQIQLRQYIENVDPVKKWFATAVANDDDTVEAVAKKKPRIALSSPPVFAAADATAEVVVTNGRIVEENKDNRTAVQKKTRLLALKYYRFDDFENGGDDDVHPNDEDVITTDAAKSTKEGSNHDKQRRQYENIVNDYEYDDDHHYNIQIQHEATKEEAIRNNEVGGPLGYGNCLVVISCICQSCSSVSPSVINNYDNDGKEEEKIAITNPSSFLVHPVGERLSCVIIDKLYMPQDSSNSSNKSSNNCDNNSNKNKIDVGGTILQIAMCGVGVTNQVKRLNQEDDLDNCQTECLVVRTSRYCVVILANAIRSSSSTNICEYNEVSSKRRSNIEEGRNENSSVLSSVVTRGGRHQPCSTKFELMELSRIDLCIAQHPSYLPVYVACDPKIVFSPFAAPTFAVLSRCCNREDEEDVTNCDGIDCTTIHEIVQVGEETRVTKHKLYSSLANISLIEYDASGMSILWAVARGANVPKSYNKDTEDDNDGDGKVLRGGYGHSLFKINLRNNSASHVWSPSQVEYTAEGVHSINGIMNDLHYKHIVWISSSSACKVWALDVRHNAANAVMCFSLAQLSDDFGPELGVAGIYGAGMIMTQPLCLDRNVMVGDDYGDDAERQQRQDTPPTMFGVKKDPNAYSLHVYQLPTTMTRFQTMPLEASSFVESPVAKHSTSCIARSNIYPLPICSDKTFRVGLVTLRCSSNSALRKIDWNEKLGYAEAPDVIYALTMTSVGDIYCHTLLECDSKREVQARLVEGMPAGTAFIPVAVGGGVDKTGDSRTDLGQRSRSDLSISLSNKFPVPFDDIALF
jgi:hypothetical protein